MARRPTTGMLTTPSKPAPETKSSVTPTSSASADRIRAMEEAEQTRLQATQEQYEARIAQERADRAAREEESGQKEYVYLFARDLDEGDERPLSGFSEVKTAVGTEGLRSLYNSKGQYENTFGSFENFAAYMDEMHELQQSNPDVYNWWETPNYEEWKNLNYSAQDIRQRGSTSNDQDLQDEYRRWKTTEHKSSFSSFNNDAAYQQLLQDYNVQTTTYNSDGDEYQWNGSFPVKMVETGVGEIGLRDVVKTAVAVGLGAALGPAIGGALTGTATGTATAAAGGAAATTTGALVQGAVNGVIGSAISQGVATGSVDASSLATAAVLGGIGGVAEGIKTGELAGTAASDAINNLSELTGLSINETTDTVKNLATGAITGDDLEGIAIGAVQGFTSGQIKNVLSETFGDEIDIENVFDEGTTTIPTSALDPFVETAVNAVFEGETEAEDVLESLVDYAQEGGSFGFLDPGLGLPDIDLDIFGNAQPFDFGDTPEEIKAIEDAVRAAGSATEDVVRAGGRFVDEEVIQRVYENVVRPLDEAVVQPTREFVKDVEDVIKEAVPQGTTPEFVKTDFPSVDLPSVDLPSVDLPSVDLPSIDFGMPQLAGGGGGMFDPYSTNIGYSPIQLQQLITSPYGVQQPALKDYELAMNGILARNSGMMS